MPEAQDSSLVTQRDELQRQREEGMKRAAEVRALTDSSGTGTNRQFLHEEGLDSRDLQPANESFGVQAVLLSFEGFFDYPPLSPRSVLHGAGAVIIMLCTAAVHCLTGKRGQAGQ